MTGTSKRTALDYFFFRFSPSRLDLFDNFLDRRRLNEVSDHVVGRLRVSMIHQNQDRGAGHQCRDEVTHSLGVCVNEFDFVELTRSRDDRRSFLRGEVDRGCRPRLLLDSLRVDVDRDIVQFDLASLGELDRCGELGSVRSTDRVVVVRRAVQSYFVLRVVR